MKRTRRGYTLLEMLAIITAITILMALSAKHIRILASEIPRSNRDHQVWLQTGNMLKQLKQDVEQSTRITAVDAGTEGKQLHLQQAPEQIVYSLTDGAVRRQVGDSTNQWHLPYVNIRWQIWERDNAAYAVEISTWTERVVFANTRKKYDQSCVYFQKTGSRNP